MVLEKECNSRERKGKQLTYQDLPPQLGSPRIRFYCNKGSDVLLS